MQINVDVPNRYLHFRDTTKDIFLTYPYLEPLRHYIFKALVVDHHYLNWQDITKYWLRPFFKRWQTECPVAETDVIIWLENSREVVTGALLPVYHELVARNTRVQLISYQKMKNLPKSALFFQLRAQFSKPGWCDEAWKALHNTVEELEPWQTRQAFVYATPTAEALVKEFDRLLKILRPKVILTAATNLSGGSALAISARQQGIPILLLQHGTPQIFYTPTLADYMLTWGEFSNDIMRGLGVPDSQLVPIGSPRHDSMGSVSPKNRRQHLLDTLGLPDLPTFVFFSNGHDLTRNGSAPLECAAWLAKIAQEYKNQINVVVRLHPKEYGDIYKDYGSLYLTKNEVSLETTLDGCDWVGSFCSTVLYEALLYNKPIWQFYADGWPEIAINWRQGLAMRVSSFDELHSLVEHQYHQNMTMLWSDELVTKVFANSGEATQHVADFTQQFL